MFPLLMLMKERIEMLTADEEVKQLKRLRRAILYWAALSFVLPFLVSCASAIKTSGMPTLQLTHVSTTQIAPSLATFGAQQYQKTMQENGKTLTVAVTSRLWLAFDQRQYPRQQIQISCQPPQAIDNHSLQNAGLMPPFYLVGYQAVEPGKCTIKNGKFLLTVKVVALQ